MGGGHQHGGSRKDLVVRDLVIAIFKLNGRIVETGNQLVADLGLTSALWQVLGALGYSPVPLPVAHIARNMGLSRQSVQRVVDLLAERDLVRFAPNPHHQRAKLVVLTPGGQAALRAAEAREDPLNRVMIDKVGLDRITSAIAVLTDMDAVLTDASARGDDDKDAA